MIAIKEQMIQTSQLDLKGCHCFALSFLIPAHAYSSDTPVTITPLNSLSEFVIFGKCFHLCEYTYNLFASLCMEITLSSEVQNYTDCVQHTVDG